ncbi:MAG: hypothetical protein ABI230_02055, partial [Aestuariivirga sp.]
PWCFQWRRWGWALAGALVAAAAVSKTPTAAAASISFFNMNFPLYTNIILLLPQQRIDVSIARFRR